MVSEPKAVARRRKLRDDLIGAAERAIAREGLRGLKARELAVEVGCAVGAIYNVFDDLDELVFAVNSVTLDQLEATLTTAGGARAQEPVEALTHLAVAYTDYAAAHTRRWRALFDHRLPEGRAVPTWYQTNLARLFVYIEEPLRKLAPALAEERRALVARSLFSAVHGIVLIGLEEKLQSIPLSTVREQVTVMVEAFAKGLSQK